MPSPVWPGFRTRQHYLQVSYIPKLPCKMRLRGVGQYYKTYHDRCGLLLPQIHRSNENLGPPCRLTSGKLQLRFAASKKQKASSFNRKVPPPRNSLVAFLITGWCIRLLYISAQHCPSKASPQCGPHGPWCRWRLSW